MCDEERHDNIDEYVRHLLDLLNYKNREIAILKAENPPPGMREQYRSIQVLYHQTKAELEAANAKLAKKGDAV